MGVWGRFLMLLCRCHKIRCSGLFCRESPPFCHFMLHVPVKRNSIEHRVALSYVHVSPENRVIKPSNICRSRNSVEDFINQKKTVNALDKLMRGYHFSICNTPDCKKIAHNKVICIGCIARNCSVQLDTQSILYLFKICPSKN